MGLDYLNKKIWHPGSMKNIQKVWEVEQEQHELNKRIKERAKKLMEERHNDELKRIQVQAGLIPRSHLDRMDWMYDWGNKVQQNKNTEDYLTGKTDKTNLKPVFQEEMTNRKCEDFVLLYEDPLFEIQKQEKARKDALLNNPFQMRTIIKELELSYLPKKDKAKREHSSGSEGENRSRSRDKKKKQSKEYQKYLSSKFDGILKTDETGRLHPDYSKHRSKYRTEIQQEEDQRRKRREKLRENTFKLNAMKEKNSKREDSEQKIIDYEQGVAKIRGQLLPHVKSNRNHKRYKEDSD